MPDNKNINIICNQLKLSHHKKISNDCIIVDGDSAQEMSNLSNVTDEGLDLSQRISDSIFQGPDLASEEEELLIGEFDNVLKYCIKKP